jgi:predicted RNA-binding protein YlxR (DUF448 family)
VTAIDGGRPGPRRTCVGCRRRAHPDALVRVVRTPDGDLAVGRDRPGRGAWICPDPACAALARKRRAWPRALRRPVDPAAVDVLTVSLSREAGEGPGS